MRTLPTSDPVDTVVARPTRPVSRLTAPGVAAADPMVFVVRLDGLKSVETRAVVAASIDTVQRWSADGCEWQERELGTELLPWTAAVIPEGDVVLYQSGDMLLRGFSAFTPRVQVAAEAAKQGASHVRVISSLPRPQA